ncbi:MAG: rane protein-like protein [Candidatus Saccharibacteria bacterium]|nr:rane protein-like protein [Candidatus Saccharibacteria bacterium]
MKTPFSPRIKVGFIIGLCMVGVIAISQLLLIHNSIRLDESQSLWQTSHSTHGTLQVVAKDVHVPLYHMILHVWQQYVGTSVADARYLSLIFFLLTIPVVYLLAREILSRRWALFATVLFSFSPFMNWYGNEARMYTMLVLTATLSQLFFTRIIKGKSGWIGYTLTTLVGIYSHYFFWFTLATQAIYYVLNRKHFPRHSFKKLIAVAVLALVAISPWIWYFRSLGSGSSTRPHLPAPSTVDLFNSFSQFAFGFQNDRINTILLSLWPLLVIVALLSVKLRQRFKPETAYLLAAGLLPIALAFTLSLVITPFFVSRYLIACLAPLTILTIWFASHYRKPLATMAVILLSSITIGGSIIQYRSFDTPVKENYKEVAAYISERATAQDQVVLSSPFTLYPFEYYYNGPAETLTLPSWDGRATSGIPAFDAQTLPEQVKKQSQNHRYAYLVLSYDQGYLEQIRQYYAFNYALASQRTFSNGLTLYVYRVGYNEVHPLSDLPAFDKVQPTR